MITFELRNKFDQLSMKRLQAKREAMMYFRLRDLDGNHMQKYSDAYQKYRLTDDELFCFMAEHTISDGYNFEGI